MASRPSRRPITEDLKAIDVPTLVLHGDDDQIVPIADSALLSVKLLKHGTLKIYPRLSARHVHHPRRCDQSRSAHFHSSLTPSKFRGVDMTKLKAFGAAAAALCLVLATHRRAPIPSRTSYWCTAPG